MFHSCKTARNQTKQRPYAPAQRSFYGSINIAFVALTAVAWSAIGGLIIGSLYLITSPDSAVDVGVGLVLIALVIWAFYPRLDSPPPDELSANLATFPAIYDMVSQVASALAVPMPMVILTEAYTAGFGRFGWRHHPVLILGHGLLSLLNREETVMLLAHELYHVNHSGWSHSRLIKITTDGLHNLIRLLSLQPLHKSTGVPLGLRLPLAPLILLHTLFRLISAAEMRRIEQDADEIALDLCAAPTMPLLLQKFALSHVPPVQRAYRDAEPSQKYCAIRRAADEIERIPFSRLWSAVLSKEPSLFDRHPTIRERIARAEHIGKVYVRPIILTQTYNLAHKELSLWPVWLDQIERKIQSLPNASTFEDAQLVAPVIASSEF